MSDDRIEEEQQIAEQRASDEAHLDAVGLLRTI